MSAGRASPVSVASVRSSASSEPGLSSPPRVHRVSSSSGLLSIEDDARERMSLEARASTGSLQARAVSQQQPQHQRRRPSVERPSEEASPVPSSVRSDADHTAIIAQLRSKLRNASRTAAAAAGTTAQLTAQLQASEDHARRLIADMHPLKSRLAASVSMLSLWVHYFGCCGHSASPLSACMHLFEYFDGPYKTASLVRYVHC